MTKEILENRVFAKTPYVIVISNPVDVVKYFVHRFTGLPSGRMIGTNTYLDNNQLAHYISTLSSYGAADFDATVLGEHGDSQVAAFSMCRVKGQRILDHQAFSKQGLEQAEQLTKEAAFQIRKTQEKRLWHSEVR